jgi:anti-anti-sigma factor
MGFLNLNGELTAEGAGRLKEALLISMDNAEHVVVNFANVTRIDSVCMRLFGIAYKKSKRLKKRVTLTGIEPETFNRLAETIKSQTF